MTRPGTWRRAAALSPLVVVIPVLFLLSPKLPDELQAQYAAQSTRLSRHLGFPLSYDSGYFMYLARYPRELFARDNLWQSRPMYVLTGAALDALLEPFIPDRPHRADAIPGARAPYIALVALNALVLLAALALFARTFPAGPTTDFVVFAFAILLIANDVVKVFFWTPHLQMFNVLTSLACLAACRFVLTHPSPGAAVMASLGLLGGLLSLFYGLFLIFVPVLLIALSLRAVPAGRLRPALALLAGFALPLVGWIALVRGVSGSFYSHELVVYRQFVWIADSYQAGDLKPRFIASMTIFLAHCRAVTAAPLALLAGVLVLTPMLGAPLRLTLQAAAPTLVAAGVTAALAFVFLGLLGLYVDRLEWNLVPPILTASAAVATEAVRHMTPAKARAFALVLVASSAAWLGYEVQKTGPWG